MNKKVYILTILVFVMAINAVFSQTTTKKLSYQAVVRNAANELVVNQNLSVEITILNANNVPQYKETHATVPTNQNGLLWLWVGDETPTLGTMDNVVWKDAVIRSVFTLPDGNTVTQNTPVTAMPHAFFADEVDTIFLQDYLTSHNYGNEDYVTQEELDDTLGHYTTTGSIDTLLGDYAKLIDLNAYEKKTDLCNDVINCIKDTLGAYYDTTDTKAAIHDTADVLRGLMVDAANDGKITIQKNNVEVDHFTVNQADDKVINITVPTTVAELTDADNYVTNAKLGDTLNAYYDTTDTKAVIHDTAQAIRSLIPIVPTNVSAFTNDAGYLTEHQSLEGYVTTAQMNDQHYLTSDSTVITTMQTNITNLQNGIKKNALCDSVNDCVHGWISDSTRMVIDSLNAYYDTTNMKTAIHDTANVLRDLMGDAANNATITIKKNNVEVDHFTLNQETDKAINITVPTTVAELTDADNYVTNAKLGDTLNAYYDTTDTKAAIHDTAEVLRGEFPVVNNGQITIAVNRGTVDNPSFNVNQGGTQTVTINIPEEATVNNGQLTIVAAGDTTRFTANQATNDTVRLNRFAKKDTLDNFVNKLAIRDSVNNIVKDSLAASNSAINIAIDTIARHNISDSTRMVFDSLHLYYATKKALKDTAASIRGDICDSATACITKALADPTSEINHAIDTIARYNIHDTAQAIRSLIPTVPTAVSAFVNDVPYLTEHQSLEGYVTTVQMDNRHYLTSDSTVITTLATRIHDDSVTLATRMDTVYKHLCDSIEQKCTNVALKSANNSFAGKNHFADSVTVPSNTTIPRPTTAEHPCTDNVASAVNVCDLLAVFDSLTNRIKKLEDEVNALKNSAPPVFNSLTLSDSTATTIKATAAFTSTNLPITEYRYCYSKNSDMSSPSCTTSTSNSITLTGLDPYTRYYVTVSAANIAGVTTSTIENARTLAYAPTASTVDIAEHKPTGFQVNVSGLDFKEPAVSGTVQICYKLKGNDECVVDPTNTYADYGTCEPPQNATNTTDIAKIINENIELDEAYCVIVKVSNADSTTIYGPFSITPAHVTLAVAGTPSVTYKCGSPEEAPQYTATLNGDSPDDYTFSWTGGTAEITDQATYNPTLSENTTVTCTATHKTLNYQLSGSVTTTVTIASVSPVIALCTEELTVTDKGSTNIDSVKWSDDETNFTLTNSVGHTYTTDGVYTITAKNSANCVATRQVVLGKVTIQPCTAPSTHVAQNLISGNDGKETVDANGKVVKVKDYDGHSYSVVQIGNQCWMAENLRTTHYGDGTGITQGSVASSAARYYIPKDGNNQNLNDSVFGLLYNWYAATRINNANDGLSEGKQGVCPQGWHVPTQSDWTTMETYVNGGTPLDHTIGNLSGDIAGKLAKGCAWTSSETEKASGNFAYSDRNAIGLGIVPAGRFNKNDTYTNYGSMAEFWVSFGGVSAYPYSWDITNDSPGTRLDYSNETNYKQYALSVRCVRDTVYSYYELSIDEDNSGASQNLNSTANVSYTATLKVDGVNVSTGVTYSWSLSTSDGATLSSTTGSTVTVTYTKNGTYSVSCTAIFNSKDITNSKTTTVSLLETTTFCSKAFLDHNSFPPAQTNKVGNDGKETVDENGNLLTVSDRDGNIYHVVEIGYPNDVWKHECWITTNLRVKTKPNGDPVDYKYPHDGENVINDSVYGLLYQWNTAMNGTSATTQWKSHVRGICPDGWHIPVPWDWLMRGGTNQYSPTYTDTAAVKFAKGNDWVSSSASDSPGDYSSVYRNKLGFSAVPAGYYDNATTSYIGYGSEARFWTTNQQNDTKAWYKALIYDQDKMQSLSTSKENYVSIRCIRNRISN